MDILDSIKSFDSLTKELNKNLERLDRVNNSVEEFKQNQAQILAEMSQAKEGLAEMKKNFDNESPNIQTQILDLEKKFEDMVLSFIVSKPKELAAVKDFLEKIWDIKNKLWEKLRDTPVFRELIWLFKAWEELSKKVQSELPEEIKKSIEPKSKWILGTIWQIITDPISYIKQSSIWDMVSDLIIIIWPWKILWFLKALPEWVLKITDWIGCAKSIIDWLDKKTWEAAKSEKLKIEEQIANNSKIEEKKVEEIKIS